MSWVTGLRKDYSDFVIEVPSLEIPDEGITVLWGASGAGKTTLFRHLIGLETCKDLKWNFKGMDLAGMEVSKRRLGIVFQEFALFEHLSARENVKFAAKAREIKNVESKLLELRNKLRLENCWNKSVRYLSVGEKQRVALARALIGEPIFLFLDEPFSALDEANKMEARDLLKTVVKESHLPTLLITHDKNDVEQLADHVIRMEKGRIVFS